MCEWLLSYLSKDMAKVDRVFLFLSIALRNDSKSSGTSHVEDNCLQILIVCPEANPPQTKDVGAVEGPQPAPMS